MNSLVATIVTLLLIACVVALGMRWIKTALYRCPVLVGLIVALTKLTPQVSLTHDVAFYLFYLLFCFKAACT